MEPNNAEVSGVNVSEKSQAQEFKEAMHRKQQGIAIERLKEMKVIEVDQVGNVILDTSMFSGQSREVDIEIRGSDQKRRITEVFELANRRLYNDPEFGDGKFDKSVFYVFKDIPVIDKKEYEEAKLSGNEAKPRALFYIPQNEESALSVDDPDAAPEKYYLNFAEVYKNNGVYPTRDNEFDSGITTLDVSLFDLVYRKLHGQRDGNGILLVNLGGDSEAHDRLNVSIINSKLSLKRKSASSFTRGLPKAAPNLYERGFFTENDIDTINYPTKEEVGNVIGASGLVTIEGLRLFLSKEKEIVGSRITKLDPNKYVVYKHNQSGQIEAQMEFRAQIIPGRESQVSIDMDNYGNPIVRASEGSFYKRKYDPHNRISYQQYSKEGKESRKIKEKPLVASLLEERANFEENGLNPMMMTQFKVESQAIIISEIDRIKNKLQKDPYQFIKKLGIDGLKVLEKQSLSGGMDPEVLDWVAQEQEGQTEIVDLYLKLHESIDKFQSSFARRLKSLKEQGEDEAAIRLTEFFTAKTADAFRYKASIFLYAAATGHGEAAQEQLGLLSGCLDAVSGAVNENGRHVIERIQVDTAKDKTKSSVTWILKSASPNQEQLSIMVRPVEKYNAGSDRAGAEPDQARISFKFKNKDGKKIGIRTDRDPNHGIALDMGVEGDELAALSENYGQSHHTQVTYDKAFSDTVIFSKTAKVFSLALGYDFDGV